MSTAEDTLSLISQPLFYGPASFSAVPKGSLSVEHFIMRVLELKLKFKWLDDRTVSMALSFMRGPARDYFQHQAKMTLSPMEYDRITTSWGHFLIHFKETFFLLSSKKDINLSWSTLQQRSDGEGADEFFNRVCSAVNEAMEMMPPPATPELGLPQFILDAIKDKKEVNEELHNLVETPLRQRGEDLRRSVESDVGPRGCPPGTTQPCLQAADRLRKPEGDGIAEDQPPPDAHGEPGPQVRGRQRWQVAGWSRVEQGKGAGANVGAVNDKKGEKKKTTGRRDMSHIKCFNCQKVGHLAKDCRGQTVAPVEAAPPKDDGATANPDMAAAGISNNPMMDHFYRD